MPISTSILLSPIFLVTLGLLVVGCIIIFKLSSKLISVRKNLSEFKSMPEENPNPVMKVDKMGTVVYANRAAYKILGQWGIKLTDKVPAEYRNILKEIIEKDIADHIEIDFKDSSYMVTFAPTHRETLILYFTDITELVDTKKQVEHGLTIEPYSKLPNRFSFYQTMKFEIKQADKDTNISLLMIMLEDWYEIIGACGVDNTEEMLRQAHKRLVDIVGPDMFISRVGEREFAIIDKVHVSIDHVSDAAAKIIESLTKPYSISGHEIKTMISIGITFFPNDAQDEETLLRNAHLALSRASAVPNLPSEKQVASKTHYEFFQRGMLDQLHIRRHIITDLYKAIPNNELELYYQPKIKMDDLSLMGCEALIRWNHPQRGLVSPAYFLNVAEQYELIHIIGQWVTTTACAQIVKWLDQGHRIKVAVNLSPRQLHHEGLVDEIAQILKTHNCPPELLELEITESGLIDDIDESIQIMNDLHKLGVSIAIDDFGTGYSSLSYLMQFPASVIKIDRSFVKEIDKETKDDHICKGIIDLGHSLNMKVVAEGVESQEQIVYLKDKSVDIIQGYYYGKPVPKQEFSKLFDQQWQ